MISFELNNYVFWLNLSLAKVEEWGPGVVGAGAGVEGAG